jgi:hypothetical protein
MYAALWRLLPGPVWLRVLCVIALVLFALFVLATWVFPWIELIVNDEEVTVGVP